MSFANYIQYSIEHKSKVKTYMITKRQKQVLNYVNNYNTRLGYSPSLEDICKHLGIKSISTAHYHINILEKLNLIKKEENRRRGIIIKEEQKIIQIPIVGKIAAGQPIEAIEDIQSTIPFICNHGQDSNKFYALKVVGNSMVDEGIFDGDIVVIKKQSVAENGQTVVAIIDDNKATLKKIYFEKDRIRLEPRNQTMLPFYRAEVEIRGIVYQIISNLDQQIGSSLGTQHKFRTIDLFAGIGGIRLGFEKAGFTTVFANDFEPQCRKTYDLNFKSSKLVVEDIRKIGIDDLPEFDFLLGGFPCQAFSIAGYREGFNDKKGRGNLFFDIARIIEARRPEGFLLENVKNLKNHDKGNTFKVIETTLNNLGYHLKTKVMNSMEYGNIPQNRERIYIVGFKNKKYIDNFEFPTPIPLTVSVIDILEDNVPKKYYYNDKPLYEKLKDHVTTQGKVYQWRRQYVRENKKAVCPTLTANMGMGGHNVPIIKVKDGIRKLTPLECARIQGFPINYKLPEVADSILYKQIGNSVSVPVIERVAEQMMKAILLTTKSLHPVQ
ncbi:MAG: transcriptional repressor LexA [Chitinophagales bacterium]|nr:transcriptional repressor LexA [Chitinophagales bacterium]